MSERPQVVILAAGRGTRMRSTRPKVLHDLGGVAIIDHVLALAGTLSSAKPLVVVSPDSAALREHLGGRAEIAEQAETRGTGDAVRSVPDAQRSSGVVVVLNGDVPLVTPESLAALVAALDENHAGALLTFSPTGDSDAGRVSLDAAGDVEVIVEHRDLIPGAVVPDDCNLGAYAFRGTSLWPALDSLTAANSQGEYYLTDVPTLINGRVAAVRVSDSTEALGINDRRQLAAAEGVIRKRTLDRLMLSGVTVTDPATTYVDASVEIGPDTVIHPMTIIRGRTRIGSGSEIGPSANLSDVTAGDRLRVGASVLEGCEIEDDVTIGHFDRIRPGVSLASGVSLGTHAEVKNSKVGAGSHINHFSCVLDSDVGAGVNIGAGTVTCNFDGSSKHRTRIADGVFVGSNSTLVAPLTIEEGSYIAAGSVVTSDVPSQTLAVGRARQRNVAGWVERRRGTPAS